MAKLRCPHCDAPVTANPIGRWYARFQCPHCRGQLQFDGLTNATGIAGSSFFFVMAWALVMGAGESGATIAWAAGALWLALIAMSYGLRRVVKG